MQKINLLTYYQELCSVLNQQGFRHKMRFQGKIKEDEYDIIDEDHPELTIMEIAENSNAYRYLTENGLLKKDICLFCGNTLVNGKYTFTEPVNRTKLNICSECHTKGRNMQGNNGTDIRSGCLSIIALFISFCFIVIIATTLFL